MYLRVFKNKINQNIYRLRRILLRVSGVKVGNGTKIYGKIKIIGPGSNLIIGDNCTINEGVMFGTKGVIVIGDNVTLSPRTTIMTSGLDGTHNEKKHYVDTIEISCNVWVASGVFIGGGVKICSGCIIGAHTVVIKSLDEPGLYVGNPATLKKRIN